MLLPVNNTGGTAMNQDTVTKLLRPGEQILW